MTDQAAILNPTQVRAVIRACEETRYPERNRAIVMLAFRAGLSVMEMAHLRRYHVLTDHGVLGDHIDLLNKPGKHLRPRRIPVPRNGELWKALLMLLSHGVDGQIVPRIEHPLLLSERALAAGFVDHMRPSSISFLFTKLFARAGVIGTSHHLRSTFLVLASRTAKKAGGSLRDVQHLAGLRSLANLEQYVETTPEARQAMVDLFEPLRKEPNIH